MNKLVIARICVALMAIFVCVCPSAANAQIKGYAVQVAALRSQQSANELAKGLIARGVNAYLVKGASLGMRPGNGWFYRVRIGKFPTIEMAYGYAEQLLGSGLLDAYAIAAYEPPMDDGRGESAPDEASAKVQSFAPRNESGAESRAEAIDLVAAIGQRGWLLLSSRSVLSTPPTNSSALSRELARLAAAVGTRGWSLKNDVTKLLAPPPVVPQANSAMAADVSVDNLKNLDFALLNPSGSSFGSAPVAPPAPRISSTSVSAPEINRRPAPPTTSTGIGARNVAYAAPPRLQGMVEMREGRMFMKLRNLDSDRSFTGMARITLSDEKNQQDVAPMQFTIAPDREELFPVDEATLVDGNWILMVYDERGSARLVRGASLAKPPAQNAAPTQTAAAGPNQAPPGFVTGVYDVREWGASENPTAPSNPAGAPGQPQNNGLVPISDNSNPANPNPAVTQNSGDTSAPPQPPVAPGQVTVTPRQIAVTAENVTMEFELSAPTPLSYITVTLRAGDFQDTRQALMSTAQGRVPFMVPVKHTSEGFFYEIKNESLQVLASGNGDFRSLGRGN
ncbi:MAG: SPOR domain-containing protein [Blastocatellia bacterium]